ncbi:hypothetical protein BHE74_00030050 [Ensete ventricosum]|nr:hypothetical protein BHE74_00030050 [Ensete ventricosum]
MPSIRGMDARWLLRLLFTSVKRLWLESWPNDAVLSLLLTPFFPQGTLLALPYLSSLKYRVEKKKRVGEVIWLYVEREKTSHTVDHLSLAWP